VAGPMLPSPAAQEDAFLGNSPPPAADPALYEQLLGRPGAVADAAAQRVGLELGQAEFEALEGTLQ
jgi:hypothetical protein